MPKISWKAGLVLSSALAAPNAANAIIMRHDVPEGRYRDLGERHRGVLVALGLPSRAGAPMLFNGMGTLIAPDWLITAAHAVDMLEGMGRLDPAGPGHYVFLKGRGYRVARIVLHPRWDPQTVRNDIALVQLTTPVEGVTPACLYEGTDERGQITEMAGQGLPGDGLTGPGKPDGALRGSTVRIDGVEPTAITWAFKAPDTPGVTPLEGISGPGDSGGPALLKTTRGWCVAGVSSEQRPAPGAPAPSSPQDRSGEGRYGVIEAYTRVSAYLPWIRDTMAAKLEGWWLILLAGPDVSPNLRPA